jgi:hypothetical protein
VLSKCGPYADRMRVREHCHLFVARSEGATTANLLLSVVNRLH